jgi:hypothetical protein
VREAPIHVRRLAHAGLGSSFDVQGDTLLAGCPGADLYGTDAGAAVLWTRRPWGWQDAVSLKDCIPVGNFGSGIELDGDSALVGARNDDEGGPFLGSWKVFRRAAGAWSLETKVGLPDAFENLSWPGPALLAGDRVFVASAQANGSRGRVVEFQLVEPQHALVCVASSENGLCAPCFDGSLMRGGCENGAVNCGTQLGAIGPSSVSADGLVLRARGLPLAASAILSQGDALAAPVPFGAGRLCVGGGLVRIARSAARSGQWTYPLPGDPSISLAGGIPSAGGLRHYQLAYRDVEGFCGGQHANVTNGVSIAWGP